MRVNCFAERTETQNAVRIEGMVGNGQRRTLIRKKDDDYTKLYSNVAIVEEVKEGDATPADQNTFLIQCCDITYMSTDVGTASAVDR